MITRICEVCKKELQTDKPALKYHYPHCKKIIRKKQFREWRQREKQQKYASLAA